MSWINFGLRKSNRILLLLILVSSRLVAVDKVALTMKTTGDVRHRQVETTELRSLSRGTALLDGDLVTTGEDGIAIALFLDDKSQLKIRKNSEVIISGVRKAGAISKQIGLAYGTVKASVEKQTMEFMIKTANSVASVKGTEFWIVSDRVAGDILIGLSGSVELTNTVSGAVHIVLPGTVVESTPEGEINVLVTVKITGEASSQVSGGRFSVTQLSVLEGDVDVNNLSGAIEVVSNTIFEGAEIDIGGVVTITGTLDEQTGNVSATLIEVSEPATIQGVVSSVAGNTFTISDVTLVAGDIETLPTEVKITSRTVVEGGEIVAGAEVTIIGNFNEETEVIEANQIIVVIPQLKISARVTAITSGGGIDISEIVVLAGTVEASALSGTVLISESTIIKGGELIAGAKVTITGSLDEETGAIVAYRIFVSQVILLAVANSPVVNNEFEITDFSVLEGDIDPSTLSGVVKLTSETQIEGGEITPGLRLTITGSIEEETGAFVATKVVIVLEERELILEMEDNQGGRRELIIKFQ